MHTYTAGVAWLGSTGNSNGNGNGYDRRHAGLSAAGFSVPLSADRMFRGDPACLNPEELLVLAAASCQLLSFLAVAARARVDVIDYRDEGTGEMPDDALTRITLRPQITVAAPADLAIDEARVLRLCEVAHRQCYVANSLRTEIIVLPVVSISLAPATL